MCAITIKRESMNFKEPRNNIWECLEGAKRREKICNCTIISKLNKKFKKQETDFDSKKKITWGL